MDLAELGYSVDSSGLVAGTKALDDNAAAAEKVSGATDRLEKDFQSLTRTAQQMGAQVNGAMPTDDGRYARIAKDAVAFAESMKGANLSERALAEAAAIAASGIDVQAQAMKNAGTEQDRMAARAKVLQEAEARVANQAREAAQATERQAINLKQLIGQIDPTIAKLDKLADMEERLEKAADLGMIKPQQFQQFQGQIDATRAKLLSAGKGSDELTGAFGRLNLQTAENQRNLAQLVTYLGTGNFGMAGSQIMQLGNSAGAASALFSGMGAAVGAAGAAVIAAVVAWKQGTDQLYDFQKNLILTGRNADISAAQYGNLVSQLDSLTGVSSGNAVNALTAVSQSGKLAGENFMLVAEAAARMEAATGQATSKTVAAFESIAASPVDALLKLNEAEGFLTRAQAARIVSLQQEGQEQQATSEAIALYAQHLDEVAEKSQKHMPAITSWWHGVTDEITGAWQEAKTYGAMIDEIVQKHAALQKSQSALSLSNTAGSVFGLGSLIPQGRLGTLATIGNMAGKQFLGGMGASGGLPTPIYDPGDDSRQADNEATKALIENATAQKAASAALEDRISGLDRASAKQAAYNKIVAMYEKLAPSDARNYDQSMDRLVSKAYADIDKQFDQRQATPRTAKLSEEDRAAKSLLESYQSMNAQLDRQVALYGDTTKAAAAAYDIQLSGIGKVNPALAQSIQANASLLDVLDSMDVADKIIEENNTIVVSTEASSNKMSLYWDQAARNMQDSFADFLFDPFSDGIKGMAENFARVLQRMAAEAASAQIIQSLYGGGSTYTGTLSTLFGSSWGFASGGYTGVGGANEPAGVVHKGEVVWSQADVARAGGVSTVEAMRLGRRGYADGGAVLQAPAAYASAGGAGHMATPQINISVQGGAQVESSTATPNGTGGFDLSMIIKPLKSSIAEDIGNGTGEISGALKGRYGLKAMV
jgi:hypothetical protein